MGYAELIMQILNELPEAKQAEVLDFAQYLKMQTHRTETAKKAATAEEMTAFFSQFQVDMSHFRFDRDDANAR